MNKILLILSLVLIAIIIIPNNVYAENEHHEHKHHHHKTFDNDSNTIGTCVIGVKSPCNSNENRR